MTGGQCDDLIAPDGKKLIGDDKESFGLLLTEHRKTRVDGRAIAHRP
jgi:hypothetical protein